MEQFKGVLYCYFWISSIFAGETSILVMNHRTRTDWNFLWAAAYHATLTKPWFEPKVWLHPLKFVLKDAIRHIPGPGWVMQLSCFLYIRRAWVHDKLKLEQLVAYFLNLKYKYSMLIFPEGTDFTDHTQRSSHRYAEKNNLQKYEYVLHPRTRGFTFLAHGLLQKDALDAVYDITLLYPDTIPQTEKKLLHGNFPKDVRMHFKSMRTCVNRASDLSSHDVYYRCRCLNFEIQKLPLEALDLKNLSFIKIDHISVSPHTCAAI